MIQSVSIGPEQGVRASLLLLILGQQGKYFRKLFFFHRRQAVGPHPLNQSVYSQQLWQKPLTIGCVVLLSQGLSVQLKEPGVPGLGKPAAEVVSL